jgi:hypothetical protein
MLQISEKLMRISRIAARACLNMKIWNTTLKATLHKVSQRYLDPKTELYSNVDISSYFLLVNAVSRKSRQHTNLDQLRELYRFLSSILEVVDGEDLESRIVDLYVWSVIAPSTSLRATY